MGRGASYTDEEIAYAAREFHEKGRTFEFIGKEMKRHPKCLARHVWRYLRERDYKLLVDDES